MQNSENKVKRRQKFLKVYIEITNVCNLRCSFCPEPKKEKRFISVEEFENIIEKICDYTDLVCFHIKGEPLLNQNLDKFLNICEKYNLKVNITTNGLLIEKWIDVFKKSNSLRQLNISLHSVEQNENIDEEKYLKYIFDSVENIRESSDIIISYRLWNLNSLENNKMNKKILNEIEKFYKIKKIEKRARKEKFIELESNVFLNQDYRFVWPDINGKIINEKGKCYGLRNQLGILSDGTIVPCCLDSNGDIPLGNIFEIDSLEEVINSKRSINLVDGFKKCELREKLCKTCGFIKRFEVEEKKK